MVRKINKMTTLSFCWPVSFLVNNNNICFIVTVQRFEQISDFGTVLDLEGWRNREGVRTRNKESKPNKQTNQQ